MNTSLLLLALTLVETGNLPARGAYWPNDCFQISASVHRQHRGKSPLDDAQKHIKWLRDELPKAGVDPNVWNLALSWRTGLTRMLAGTAPEDHCQFATRVQNTFDRLRFEQHEKLRENLPAGR